jgi:4-amino-4-deoxy-L-arabinose transferase-like glycosyltransferase
MRETHITLPELGLVAATRGMLGFGLGLLLADRFSPDQRRAVGWTLVAIGLLTTVPLAADVLGKSSPRALPAARAVP